MRRAVGHCTLVVKDVLGVGEHAREYAAEEEPTETGSDEQNGAAGVENEQHRHGSDGARLQKQRKGARQRCSAGREASRRSERSRGLTMLITSSFMGLKRYESGMDSRRPPVIAAQKTLAR